MESLVAIHSTLNSSIYSLALNKDVPLADLKLCLKQLNAMMSTVRPTNTGHFKHLVELTITLYETVKTNKKWFKTASDTLLWLCSNINNELFFPYDPQIGVFLSNDSDDLLPKVDLNDNENLINLYQDTLVNCSLVSCILSLVASEHHRLLLRSIIKSNSSSTQFIILFNVNGATRTIQITSQLPLSGSSGDSDRPIVLKDNNDQVKWPYLIEKAYIKLLGFKEDYNLFNSQFQGSNFANDLFILIGFIPDYHNLFDTNSLLDYADLEERFENGELLLGLGTGDLTNDEIDKFGLIPNHDYSIIGFTPEKNGFVLKNPWLNKRDAVVLFNELFKFNVLYVNWNPECFRYYQVYNFFHKANSGEVCSFDCLQLAIKLKKRNSRIPGKIWILLENHMDNKPVRIELIWFKSGFKIWQEKDKLISLSNNNSRFLLSKLDSINENVTGVFKITGDNQATSGTNFYSLHVYSDIPIDDITKPTNKYPYYKELTDYWTPMQTGGNWLNSQYNKNPQFEIEFPGMGGGAGHTDLVVGLVSGNNVKLNISVFDNTNNKFKFLTDLSTRLVGYESNYDEGYQFLKLGVDTNKRYLVVASTYHTGEFDEFRIVVNCAVGFKLVKVDSSSFNLFECCVSLTTNEHSFELTRDSKLMVHVLGKEKNTKSVKLIRDDQVIEESNNGSSSFGIYLGGGLYPKGVYTVSVESMTREINCNLTIGSSVTINSV